VEWYSRRGPAPDRTSVAIGFSRVNGLRGLSIVSPTVSPQIGRDQSGPLFRLGDDPVKSDRKCCAALRVDISDVIVFCGRSIAGCIVLVNGYVSRPRNWN